MKEDSKLQPLRRLAAAGAMAAFAATAAAQTQADEPTKYEPKEYGMSEDQLAQQLNNPLANLITVPVQNNFDYGGGPDDKGFRYTLVAQPVLPFKLNNEWNLITRTVIPFAHVDNVFPSSESGLGDIVQSLWFSPSRPTEGGLVWGVGPAILYPTATNDLLGAKQWGLGPTAVAVWLRGPWTFLLLGIHTWGLDPPDDRQRVNQSFGQIALAYTAPTRTTYFVSTESTYNWNRNQGTVPLQMGINQLFVIDGKPIQFGGLLRYYAEKPDGVADWGFQLRVTFIFPR
jgi:hypothetical protein